MDSGERGMNPVAMTMERILAQPRRSNHRPPFLKSSRLTTEPRGGVGVGGPSVPVSDSAEPDCLDRVWTLK